jgi:hypothetical protein
LSRGTSYEKAHTHVTGLNPSQVIKVFCELNGLPAEFFTIPLDWHQPHTWTAEQRQHGTIHLANGESLKQALSLFSQPTSSNELLPIRRRNNEKGMGKSRPRCMISRMKLIIVLKSGASFTC